MSEERDWKLEAYMYATREPNGELNYRYEEIVKSDNLFETGYGAGLVKNLVTEFGYEYVEMMVEHDADDLDKMNARKAEGDAKKAEKAINANDKLNDIINRAEAEDDAD